MAVAGQSFRHTVLVGLLLMGVAVALLTELLSPFGLLRQGPLLACWFAICLGAALWAYRSPALAIELPRLGLLDALSLAGIAAITLLVGFTALLSPPNSADAMAYHMPRVVYWAQAGSVSFFPTPYYNQITMPPLAEYFMLHFYVLAGSDRYANLVQFIGFFGSAIGVSLIARETGAGRRGQAIAAVFCATLPAGILQASGAKNDLLLSLWLVAMVYFAIRMARDFRPWDIVAAGLALGLALLTKGTAYLFAPPLLAAVIGPVAWRRRRKLLSAAAMLACAVLLLNGPQYWRNHDLSGSALGYDSAHGDGRFRWANDRFGPGPIVSNLLRNFSDHLGARSLWWNQAVYDFVTRVHDILGIDPNDPATTWLWAHYEPPRNANHEANVPNRWHLLLVVIAFPAIVWFAWRRGYKGWLCYYSAILLAFLLFCYYLKWQPFLTRLHLPLFVAASPLIGLLGEQIRPALLQAVLIAFLLNNSRPYLFENWVRPLSGPNSLLGTSRDNNYFSDMTQWHNRDAYLRAIELVRASGCTEVGIDISEFQLEYPAQALLRRANPAVRFQHVGVSNRSLRYRASSPPKPCAVLCLECAGRQEKLRLYTPIGEPVDTGGFLVFRSRVE